jgi:hypothetical protein
MRLKTIAIIYLNHYTSVFCITFKTIKSAMAHIKEHNY